MQLISVNIKKFNQCYLLNYQIIKKLNDFIYFIVKSTKIILKIGFLFQNAL